MGIRIAPALVVLLAGCAAPPGLDADHLAALSELSPATLPPPPADRSNRVADSAAAAELGQRWFFDPGFSGQLLDSDNVAGNINTLGAKGESGKVACSGCHIPKDGFSDTRSGQGRQISLAAGWGRRRTPSLLDIGQVALLMWDGRRDDLYNQVFGPTESPIEANSSRLYLAEQIFARYRDGYEAVFGPMVPADDPDRFTDPVRFPPLTGQTTGCQITGDILTTTCPGTEHGIPGDGAEYDHMRPADQDAVTEVVVNVGKAIAAYERMLTCGPSRFDAWMHGDATALDAAEQRGAALFVGKAGCVSCHSGPFLSDQQFHNVGLAPHSFQSQFTDTDDRGAAVGLAASIADPLNTRGPWSDAPGQGNSYLPAATPAGMEGAFRTPMLRCLSGRPTFMHTGQLATLRDVVAFFTRGGHATGYPGTSELQPLDLDDAEQADLVAFLESLDGPGPDPHLLAEP